MRFLVFTAWCLLTGFQTVAQNLQTYQKNNFFGLADATGKPITSAIYNEILPGTDYSIVRIWNKAQAQFLTGTVDAKGKTLITPAYIDLKRDGLRLIACRKVKQSFRYGLLVASGKEIIPLDYVSVQSLGSMRYAVENDEKKFAIYTDEGINLTGFTLENLISVKPNLIQFTQNGLLGLLDRQGNIVKEARYTTIKYDDESVVGVWPQQWELISVTDFTKKEINAKKTQFTSAGYLLIEHKKNSNQLFSKQLQAIGKTYAQINETPQAGFFIVEEKEKQLIVTNEGIPIENTRGDSIVIHQQCAMIRKGKHWQTFSLKLNSAYQHKYDSFRILKQHAVAYKQGYAGLLNNNGEEVIPCVYENVEDVNENQILVKIKGLTGIIDWQEKWLLPPQPNGVTLVNDKLYLLTEGKLKYLKNFQHQVIYFTNNFIQIKNNYVEETTSRGEKWKIDAFGIVTSFVPKINQTYQHIQLPTEGFSAIKKNDKWGFIDLQGRLRIANRYDSVMPFTNGHAAFKLRNKWGLLNKEDKIVLQPGYDTLLHANAELLIGYTKKLGGIINYTGEVVLPIRFDLVKPWEKQFYLLQKDSVFGWADKDGKLIVEPKYQKIKLAGNFIAAKILDKWGLVNWDGSQKIPAVYTTCEVSADGQFILVGKEIKTEVISIKQ
ncbi:MAG: WG repeat-containing protein [Flammeovirgaceae bacterium]|jgi:hypothetical protein|nr:WG repeat-containing protein [Flammeovirgaceae bacterium]